MAKIKKDTDFMNRRVYRIAAILIFGAVAIGFFRHFISLFITSESYAVASPWLSPVFPPELHGQVTSLVLIPLGLLVVTIFRNVVGISTFGTSTPVLLAIALKETSFLFGLIFLIASGLVGSFVRQHLGRFHILLIPTLSIVLTVVAASMLTIVLVLHHQGGFPLDDHFSLLLIVVITWMIERFAILQIEDSARAALKAAAGTLLVAIVTYGIIRFHRVSHFLLLYPETILIITGLLLLLGRYTGLRWTECHRFRDLMKK